MYRTNKMSHEKKSANINRKNPDSAQGDLVFQEYRHRLSSLEDQTLLIRAAAKINLTLAVGPLRSDGYHMFNSLMSTITLYDDLLMHQGTNDINLTCDDGTLPVGSDNLVHRACSLFAAQADIIADVDIELIKRIPTQAGLGGGSADAAGTLIGLNELWGLHWSTRELSRMAAMLGSDVNFFLNGPLAVCSGRGEIVEPLDFTWNFWGVVIKPPWALSTAQVYRNVDDDRGGDLTSAERLAQLLPRSKPSQIVPYLTNDLEAPAFKLSPQLGTLRLELEKMLNVPVRLSGSGSALFALFDFKEQAASAFHKICAYNKELTCWMIKNNAW